MIVMYDVEEFTFAVYFQDFLKLPLFNHFDRFDRREVDEAAEEVAVGGANERDEDHEIDQIHQITEITDSLSLYDTKGGKNYDVWAHVGNLSYILIAV